MEETNLCFVLGFPTLKKFIRFDLTRFKNAIVYLVKIISNHDTLANKNVQRKIQELISNEDAIVHIIKLCMYSHQTSIQLYFN